MGKILPDMSFGFGQKRRIIGLNFCHLRWFRAVLSWNHEVESALKYGHMLGLLGNHRD